MQFLTGIIPGLREVRGPLIAGYMWLLFAWLLVDPRLPLSGHTGVVGSVAALADEVGPIATAVAISIGAYLVGAVSHGLSVKLGSAVRTTRRVWRQLRLLQGVQDAADSAEPMTAAQAPFWLLAGNTASVRPDPRPAFKTEQNSLLEIETKIGTHGSPNRTPPQASLTEKVVRTYAHSRAETRHYFDRLRRVLDRDVAAALGPTFQRIEAIWDRLSLAELWEVSRRSYVASQAVGSELELSGSLLVAHQAETFAEVDRLRGEGDFRLAVVPPLVALSVLLCVTNSAWWLAILPGAATLFAQALAREDQARQVLAGAIAYQPKVPSDARDALRTYVDALEPGKDFDAVIEDLLGDEGALVTLFWGPAAETESEDESPGDTS